MMHAARLESSDRLRRVLAALADGAEHSTLDLIRLAGVCAVNSCIAELRANGAAIACRRTVDPAGRRRWLYRLEKRDRAPAAAGAERRTAAKVLTQRRSA